MAPPASHWMDTLAPLVDELAIKPEKGAWSLVSGVMETFLWLDSECARVGREWWNYACLARLAHESELGLGMEGNGEGEARAAYGGLGQ